MLHPTAKDIAAALNETRAQPQIAIKKQMEGFRFELRKLEGREDVVYADFKRGVLDEAGYHRQIQKVREERQHYEREIERLTLEIGDEAMTSAQKVLELATNAKSLWKSMEPAKRLDYIKKECLNPTLEDLTLHYQLEKPFARLASWKENKEWRRGRDSNPRYPCGVCALSKGVPSATRPPLRGITVTLTNVALSFQISKWCGLAL